jgi:hypothetical protein
MKMKFGCYKSLTDSQRRKLDFGNLVTYVYFRFIATEAFPEYDEKGRLVILKRLNFIVSTFEERGVFDFLPAKYRNLWSK